MAGKQKPPRPLGEKAGLGEKKPLGEKAGSKRPAGSPKKQRPSTGSKGQAPPPRGEAKEDRRQQDPPSPSPAPSPKSAEHLRQRLESVLASAAVSSGSADSSLDLRTRLQAALEPTAGHAASAGPPEPDPVPLEPQRPVPPVAEADVDVPAGDRSARARGVLLVVGLLLIGSIGVVLIRSVGRDSEAPGRLSTTSAQPAAPVPVRAGSSYVATRVLPNGSVSVSHWVRPRAPAYELTLSVPDVPGRGPLRAADVRVDVDGTAIPGPASIESSPHTYVLAGGRQIFVTYHLTGALERSPSVEGRALVRVTSLDLSVEDVVTRTQAVEGVEILSMACTAHTEERSIPEPCGETIGDRWEVRLTGPDLDDRVMAQVNLG